MTARLLDRMRRLGWPRLPVLAAASGALLSLRGGANRGHDQPSGATRGSGPRLFPLLLAWLLLLVLLAVEFGISFLAIGRPARPLITSGCRGVSTRIMARRSKGGFSICLRRFTGR